MVKNATSPLQIIKILKWDFLTNKVIQFRYLSVLDTIKKAHNTFEEDLLI